MGGVSRPARRGIGRDPGEPGAIGFPAEAAQAPARPEEAEAQETERGEDQTCRHREDPKSSSSVYKITPPKGWLGCTPPVTSAFGRLKPVSCSDAPYGPCSPRRT